jgi:Zn-dependent M28 family amino/carboxypeptidase
MKDTLEFLTAISPARNFKNLKSLNAVADYIFKRFENIGLETSFQDYSILGVKYKNVIGVLNSHLTSTIIVGGHYDVCGNQQGADDNASAVAGVIETAKQLTSIGFNKYRVEFVAFTLEEPPFFNTPLMGSYVHAKSKRNDSIIGMINYEMIGYFSEEENSQKYPFVLKHLIPSFKDVSFPTKGNFIGLVSNKNSELFLHSLKFSEVESNIESFELVVPKILESTTASDHLNYWKFNIPAVMITDTAHFRNPNYHKKTDTLDTLNQDKMGDVIDMVVKGILNL